MNMHLHDPSRPKLGNGMPCLLSGGAAPTIYLHPLETGRWRFMIFLLAHGTSYRPHHIDVPWSQVASMLTQWESDPEACCREWFSYGGPVAEPKLTSKIKGKPKESDHAWLVRMGLSD